MTPLVRLRYKVVTSFAIALLALIALARLAMSAPLSSATAPALGIAALIVVAAVWRGIIYLRAVRAGARSCRV